MINRLALKLFRRIKRELAVFKQLNRQNQLLLLCSTLYWLANPFVSLFLNIYLWRVANSLLMVACFNLFLFLGVPFGFILNGWLLRKLSNKTALRLGLILQGVFPLILILLGESAFRYLPLLGFINGINVSFYWGNYNLFIYDLTTDKTRGYYTGINTLLSTAAATLASPLAGLVIGVLGQGWLQLEVSQAYYLSFILTTFIFVLAAMVVGQINTHEEALDFSLSGLLAKKSPGWNRIRLLNLTTGFYGGVFSFSLGILAFYFFGQETGVGWFNGLIGIISALAAYLAGRLATPSRRILTALVAAIPFFIGSLIFSLSWSLVTFYVFAILTGIGTTALLTVKIPLDMKEMDQGHLSETQRYKYLVDLEIFLNSGRALGILLLILLANVFSFELAYRLTILVIGFIPFIVLKLVKNLNG
ncbi:MFS transporter [Patescibacteria group bacterium]|nr:MFS transporter [Patescibacteria group bacterium]MBU1931343.1 MFS transporter [Patescibacteria group bacterium]